MPKISPCRGVLLRRSWAAFSSGGIFPSGGARNAGTARKIAKAKINSFFIIVLPLDEFEPGHVGRDARRILPKSREIGISQDLRPRFPSCIYFSCSTGDIS